MGTLLAGLQARLTPVRSGTVASFDIGVRTRDNRVGVEFTGWLNVSQEGLYTFSTESDDGSHSFVGESALQVEVLGVGPAPSPRRMTPGVLIENQEEQQWAEMEGRIVFACDQPYGMELELASETARARVLVADGSNLCLPVLRRCRVRVAGVCQSVSTPEGRHMAGELVVLDGTQIVPSEAAPEVWQAYPLTTISNALRAGSIAPSEGVVHLCGRVESLAFPRGFAVSDGTGRLMVETSQAVPAASGSQVELLGRLTRAGTNVVFQSALYRQASGNIDTQTPPLPALMTAEAVKRLTRPQAQAGYPVRIRGVVTHMLRGDTSMVIQDATCGIYVRFGGSNPVAPRRGECWEVEGVTATGDFAPIITAHRLERLGLGRLPDPLPATWDQLVNGSLDTQFVELQGMVIAVRPSRLELLLPEGRIVLVLPDLDPQLLPRYLNCLVRVRGCVFPGLEHPDAPGQGWGTAHRQPIDRRGRARPGRCVRDPEKARG